MEHYTINNMRLLFIIITIVFFESINAQDSLLMSSKRIINNDLNNEVKNIDTKNTTSNKRNAAYNFQDSLTIIAPNKKQKNKSNLTSSNKSN
jgi:hypothetical protein